METYRAQRGLQGIRLGLVIQRRRAGVRVHHDGHFHYNLLLGQTSCQLFGSLPHEIGVGGGVAAHKRVVRADLVCVGLADLTRVDTWVGVLHAGASAHL